MTGSPIYKLHGRLAMVTGGSQGLGLSISECFLAAGARVMLVSRDGQRLREKVAEFQASLGEDRVGGLDVDLTAPDAPQQVVEQTTRWAHQPVDILVNCAGVFSWGNMLDITSQQWTRMLQTNLTAPFLLTQALVKALAEDTEPGRPSVINIASIHGVVPDGNVVAQSTAKAGLLGMTRAAAEALRPLGVRVNAIVPGAIMPESGGTLSSDLSQRITQEDVARLALYLACEDSRGITGAAIEAYGVTRPVIGAASPLDPSL